MPREAAARQLDVFRDRPPPDGRPYWLGSGAGWEYVGRNRNGDPIYRRRVLRRGVGGAERDMWQRKYGDEHRSGYHGESFRLYDGPPDRPQYEAGWWDLYVDGDPSKGYVRPGEAA